MDAAVQLVDTNVLVYRYDDRYPEKQAVAGSVLRAAIATSSLRVPYQALVEFVSATTRVRADGRSILPPDEARREAEEESGLRGLVAVDPILYPNEAIVRTAFRGVASYKLNWFDANIWACAEHYGCGVLLTEDLQHGRMIGAVMIHNPFQDPEAT